MHEIRVHKLLQHQNIVAFETYFEDEENIYILLELCKGQTVFELLDKRKTLVELEVRYYLSQLISGVKYLHDKRIIHRDLKPNNIFLNDNNQIKIGDFGIATKIEFRGQRKRTICGTPCYTAPEVMYGRGGHSYEVDIWSLGIIIYNMLVGKLPFKPYELRTNDEEVVVDICNFPLDCTVSSEAKELVSKMLDPYPEDRPTLNEIMEHPFMTDNGNIPAALPASALATKPSKSFLALASLTKEEQEELKAEKTERTLKINFRFLQKIYLNDESMRRVIEAGRELLRDRVWIKQWIKHSDCLGYLLTTGAIGVHFKGETKMLSNYKTK